MSRRSPSEEYSSLLYKELDRVEVYSNSAKKWLEGTVLTVDPAADRVTVEYANDAGMMMKKALLMNSEDIKPLKQRSNASKKPARRSSQRSADDSDSGDDTDPSPYTREDDHPSSVAIAGHGQEGGVTFYTIEVYSGEPPKHKWQKEKRYSEVDQFKKELAAAKGWKKYLDSYEFPAKRMSALDDEAQLDRKRKLETWLNSVLSLTEKKRGTGRTKDQGVQLCDEFFGPQWVHDVQPVVKPATVDKSNRTYDREDERAYNKTMKHNKLAEKKDPELRRKAKVAKERAIHSPPSQQGDDESQSSDEDSDEEDCFEQVQGYVEDCCTWVQTLCGACVMKCKEYAKVEDEEDEEDEEDGKRRGARRKR
jgi:hypothetical protein